MAWALPVFSFGGLLLLLFDVRFGTVMTIEPAGGFLRTPDWTCRLDYASGLRCPGAGWTGLMGRLVGAAIIALLPIIFWDWKP